MALMQQIKYLYSLDQLIKGLYKFLSEEINNLIGEKIVPEKFL